MRKVIKKVFPIMLAVPLVFSCGGTALAGTYGTVVIMDEETEETATVTAGDVISEGGTYQVSTDATNGTITVATDEAVTLVGSGISGGNHPYLSINCTKAGTGLTIQNLRIDSPDDGDTYAISFTGEGNTLTVEGENLIQNCTATGDEYALIRVPDGTGLTVNGSGILRMYVKTDGAAAAIGADANDTCGKIVFDGATVQIYNSKNGLPIGGISTGEVVIRSGELALENGSAAGEALISASSVVMEGGAVRLVNGGKGYDICAGKMTVTGGSLICNADAVSATVINSDGADLSYCEVSVPGDVASSDTWVVTVDDELYYSGAGHVYTSTGGTRTNDAFGLFLTGENHEITINGTTEYAVWNSQTMTFTVSETLSDDDSDDEDPDDTQDGAPETDAEGYYLLSAEDDIVWFADRVSSGYTDINGRLLNDIVLTDTAFAGIGTGENPFSGRLDGNGCSIEMNLAGDGTAALGLVACASGATIENLTVLGSVDGGSASAYGTGGIVGLVSGDGVTVTNCTNQADVTAKSHAGGLIGYCADTASVLTVSDCTNRGSVTTTSSGSGGIVGYATAIYVSGSENTGDITGTYAAGIAGYFRSGAVSDCTNRGTVSGTGSPAYAGGIVGNATPSTTYKAGIVIEDSINYGDVTSSGSNTGGVVGSLGSTTTAGIVVTVQRCGNEGNVTSSKTQTGGVVGYESSTVTTGVQNVLDSLYNTGSVSGTTNVGGIIGSCKTCYISNIYNQGTISGTEATTGGLIGYSTNNSTKGYRLVLTNAYNVGKASYISDEEEADGGMIVGKILSSSYLIYLNNVYYLGDLGDSIAAIGADYIYMEGSETAVTAAELQVSSGELAALADTLGDSFTSNTDADYHMGYPVLTWETDAADDGGDGEVLNGLYADENGALAYYADGVIDTTYTGMVKDEAGTWYYVVNGYADTDYTGMVKYAVTGVWYYFSDGSIVWDYTGIAKHASTGVWYYFSDGSIVWDYTGIAKNTSTGVWYYFSDGSIVWDYTGMAKNTSTGVWYYFSDGTIDWNYTGMAKHPSNGLWYYFTNGVIDWTYTGWVTTENGSWYFTNGQIDWSYTAA